jgi:uncharacterized protein YvpB
MRKYIYQLPFIVLLLIPVPVAAQSREEKKAVILEVPFVSEAPDGLWVGPWKNACEEAAIAMADYYYAGKTISDVKSSKALMQKLFNRQDALYGSNADSDAARTKKIADDVSSFNTTIKNAPTIEEIKSEIQGGRPVITFHYGFALKNKNIPFLSYGSSYHSMLIIGYDDEKKEFVVNDVGDAKTGAGHRYAYDLFMSSLKDFNYKNRKADGPPRVLFTHPKLAKTADSHRIYYLSDGERQYVSHPLVFAQKKWSWAWVNIVANKFLIGFSAGPSIVPKR